MKATKSTTRADQTEIGDHLVGYRVEGNAGTIGKVEHVTYNKHCIVVRIGPRLFRQEHILLASAVRGIEPSQKRIFVELSEDEVKGAPEYDHQVGCDDEVENVVEAYYSPILLERGLEALEGMR